MKALLEVRSYGDSGVAYAIVEITREIAQRAVGRILAVRELSQKVSDVQRVEFRDWTPGYYEWSEDVDELALEEAEWLEVPDDFTLPDKIEAEVSLAYATDSSMFWQMFPYGTSQSVFTTEIGLEQWQAWAV